MYQRSLLIFPSLAVGSPTAFADTFSVTLKAVDADKKPVAKAEAALFWNVKDGAMTPAGEKPIVTDAAAEPCCWWRTGTRSGRCWCSRKTASSAASWV